MTLKIAIASTVITNDVTSNCNAIIAALNEAAANGSELLLTSECALSGYAPTQLQKPTDYAFAEIETNLARIQREAAQNNMWVVLGSAVLQASCKYPFNSQIIIDPAGKVVAKNHKNYPS